MCICVMSAIKSSSISYLRSIYSVTNEVNQIALGTRFKTVKMLTLESLIIGIVTFVRRLLFTSYSIAFKQPALASSILRNDYSKFTNPHVFFVICNLIYSAAYIYGSPYTDFISDDEQLSTFTDRLLSRSISEIILDAFPIVFFLYIAFFIIKIILNVTGKFGVLFDYMNLYSYGISIVYSAAVVPLYGNILPFVIPFGLVLLISSISSLVKLRLRWQYASIVFISMWSLAMHSSVFESINNDIFQRENSIAVVDGDSYFHGTSFLEIDAVPADSGKVSYGAHLMLVNRGDMIFYLDSLKDFALYGACIEKGIRISLWPRLQERLVILRPNEIVGLRLVSRPTEIIDIRECGVFSLRYSCVSSHGEKNFTHGLNWVSMRFANLPPIRSEGPPYSRPLIIDD